MVSTATVSGSLIERARPLFILGSARSGTTFLTRLLSSHPEVMVTNETALFLLLDDVANKSKRGVASGLNYSKEHGPLIARWLDSEFRRMIQSVYESIAVQERRHTLRYWGEKHPHIFPVLDRIATQFPDAMYIYLVRNPARVIASLAVMAGSTIEEALGTWKIFTDAYENFAAGADPMSLLTVRYEDVAAAPAQWMEEMFVWLGVDKRPPEFLESVEKWRRTDAHNGVQLDLDGDREVGGGFERVSAHPGVQEAVRDFCAKYSYGDFATVLQT